MRYLAFDFFERKEKKGKKRKEKRKEKEAKSFIRSFDKLGINRASCSFFLFIDIDASSV